MPLALKTLPVLALLAWTLPLAAQEAPAAEPTAEAPAPEATTGAPAAESADPGLNMGEPASAASGEPQVGQPYVREESGDWALRCLKTESGDDPCQLYQLLEDSEGNAVAEISMFPLPEGSPAAAGATIVAPLETLLTENLTLGIDGNEPKRYPFTFCNRAGCVARVGFTAEEVQQFRSGNAVTMSIVPAAAPDQTVDLTISLSGFTAGFEKATPPSLNEGEAPAEAPAE
ncbi:MAG TPA: invasion associated locus B family protein [Rubellimicrobium sp.]|nr:invasion associated locus B family protein [Rubellimicrobium sp.]